LTPAPESEIPFAVWASFLFLSFPFLFIPRLPTVLAYRDPASGEQRDSFGDLDCMSLLASTAADRPVLFPRRLNKTSIAINTLR
jgi:hypothetical protein